MIKKEAEASFFQYFHPSDAPCMIFSTEIYRRGDFAYESCQFRS